MAIQFGDLAKDSISGFVGIVVGQAEYLYGTTQVLIQPKTLNAEIPVAAQWFDERRIELSPDKPKQLGFAIGRPETLSPDDH